MLEIDLTGRRALVAGVADDAGFGFAIAKSLAEAGASVCVGTWPPALTIFLNLLERGKMDESRRLSSGTLMAFEKIYPLDAIYDTFDEIPEDVRTSKRYKEVGDCSIGGVAERLVQDFGDKPLDIVVHSLANAPEVKKSLLDVSRPGYLAAMSASAYSLVSMVGRFGPIMRPAGSFISLTYLASERVIPGYGGGMSSAKAALESDTRLLAFDGPAMASASTRSRRSAASRGATESSRRWWTTCRRTHRLPTSCARRRLGRRRLSCRRRSPAGSPAPPFTSTRATTRWAWRCRSQSRNELVMVPVARRDSVRRSLRSALT
jgi:enoyl-[acyl-carrier protein] reductase I